MLLDSPALQGVQVETSVESSGLLITRAMLTGRDAAEVHWALLADPHLSSDPRKTYLGFSPDQNMRKAAGQVATTSPDAAVVAGDISWLEGLPEDYSRFKTSVDPLARRVPTCLTVGNHDSRENFLEAFRKGSAAEPNVDKTIAILEQPPIRMVVLDSLYRTDVVPGLLGKSQRHWLTGFLERSDKRPTFLCVHHPLNEEDGSLLDGDRLLTLVHPFRQVKAIFTAHDHVYRLEKSDGLHVVGLPALGFPFEESEAAGWVEATLTLRGGDFTLHTIAGQANQALETVQLEWRD